MPRIIRVLSRLPTAFRMAVNMVLRREDSGLVCRLRMDVKHSRLLVVDPDDGVRHDLILSAKPIVEPRDGCYRVGVLGDAATSSLCACFRQYGVQGMASIRGSSMGPPSTRHVPNVPSSTRPSASRTCCSIS